MEVRRSIPLSSKWRIRKLDCEEICRRSEKVDNIAWADEILSSETGWYDAASPLSIHEILLAHGVIGEEVFKGECDGCKWVAESDARFVTLSGNDNGDEFGWIFSDNYFDLFPFETRRIKIGGKHTSGEITAKAQYSGKIARIRYGVGI